MPGFSVINSSKIHTTSTYYTKHLIKKNNRFYFQIRIDGNTHQYALKTDYIRIALIRRDVILMYWETLEIPLNNDSVTLEVISKMLNHKIKYQGAPEYEEEQEQIQQIKHKEEQSLYFKLLQHQQLLQSIQQDTVGKFQNLSSGQIKEQGQQSAPVKQYLGLKEYWSLFVLSKEEHLRINKKVLSKDTKDRMNIAYSYLVDFLDGNEDYNVCDLTSKFFKELQIKYTKIPSRAVMYPEFRNKSMKEVIASNFDKDKFPVITTTYINSLFSYYKAFFVYLDYDLEVYENTLFQNFKSLDKHEAESYKEFTYDELKLLIDDTPNTYDRKNINQDAVNFIKLAMYTGFRLNELAQIKKSDIAEEEGVLCFNLTEDKQLKNKQSIRKVPVHSQIINLVKQQIKDNKGDYLIYSGDSKEIGKKVLKYIKIYVKEDKKVIHSLRSNFIQELYANDVEERIIKKLVGHTSDKTDVTNDRYNKNKATMTQLVSAIEKVVYRGIE